MDGTCARNSEIKNYPLIKYPTDFPLSRALLEKLIVSQLVNKLPAIYGTRKFSTIFRNATTGLLLSQLNPVHSYIPYFSNSYFNIMLLSTLRTSKWPFPFCLFG
jgi:hypothetical protein